MASVVRVHHVLREVVLKVSVVLMVYVGNVLNVNVIGNIQTMMESRGIGIVMTIVRVMTLVVMLTYQTVLGARSAVVRIVMMSMTVRTIQILPVNPRISAKAYAKIVICVLVPIVLIVKIGARMVVRDQTVLEVDVRMGCLELADHVVFGVTKTIPKRVIY
jgi:hypothetical protein